MTERYNAGNPKHVKERREQLDDKAKRNQDELAGLLKIPEFRRFIWRQIGTTCKLLETAQHPNGSQQSFNLGMQNVALILWAEIEQADALAIPQMMAETNKPLVAVKPDEQPTEGA